MEPMKRIDDPFIDEANNEVLRRIIAARPILVGLAPAKDVIPDMRDGLLLHGGPPLEWNEMAGPMKGAACGALVFEGIAASIEEARALCDRGDVAFEPCHAHSAVGPMAGIISPSMPVYCVNNETFGNMAHATINEGLGKTLRFGANDEEVLNRLRWMKEVLGPALAEALAKHGPIDLKDMMAAALRRGDECHNRNKSGTTLFLKTLAPALARTCHDRERLARTFEFIGGNDHFFLNLSMAASKATMDAVRGVEGSTIVWTMAGNGVRYGIAVSWFGDQWFTALPEPAVGKYFQGFSQEDACPVMGDSYISEPAGVGGFAMASAPAITSFIGGKPSDAVEYTTRMYRITLSKHPDFTMPNLDYEGTPLGIDVRKVVETGILPVVNSGIAHREAGIGQIGAGIAYPPMACFEQAMEAIREAAALKGVSKGFKQEKGEKR
jgi:hypothetical protein